MTDLWNPHVVEQEMTCGACPVQIEGRLDDGRYFYFRYRSGRARLGLGMDDHAAVGQAFTEDGAAMSFGDGLQGFFESDDDMNEVFDHLLARAIRGTESVIDLGVLNPGDVITPEPGTTVTWSE